MNQNITKGERLAEYARSLGIPEQPISPKLRERWMKGKRNYYQGTRLSLDYTNNINCIKCGKEAVILHYSTNNPLCEDCAKAFQNNKE